MRCWKLISGTFILQNGKLIVTACKAKVILIVSKQFTDKKQGIRGHMIEKSVILDIMLSTRR